LSRAAAVVDRYLLLARARPQQQTRQPLLSIDGTDRRTDGRTIERFMLENMLYRLIAYSLNNISTENCRKIGRRSSKL